MNFFGAKHETSVEVAYSIGNGMSDGIGGIGRYVRRQDIEISYISSDVMITKHITRVKFFKKKIIGSKIFPTNLPITSV